jgi:hypothetical protein
MTRTLLAVTLILTGCGGASEGAPPKDATDPPEPAAAAQATAAPAPAANAEAATPQAPSEIPLVLQAVLDDPELEPYLRLDKPERFPVKISGPGLAPGIEVAKGGKPVEVVTDSASAKDPVLVFTKIDVGAEKASVTYRYKAENLRGSCSLAKRNGAWEVSHSRLTQD